jgi:hypothetical protein
LAAGLPDEHGFIPSPDITVRGENKSTMATPTPSQEPPDFSFTLEGPLSRFLGRSEAAIPVPTLLCRRAVLSILVCWVPLAILSLIQSRYISGIHVSFLRDIETHIRFLVSLPILILAEIVVKQRIGPVLRRFVERQIVRTAELPQFYTAINSAVRILNSVVVEIALLVFVYAAGHWIWRHQIASDVASWYATSQGGQIHLTTAGYWLAFVSVPVFQFILLRWYLQFVIWFWFLFRVSRLKLHLPSLHPDRAGGLAFVGATSMAFAPLLFAHSALLSAQVASGVFYHRQTLFASELTIAGYVILSVAAALLPLFSFTPQLIRSKRRGLAKYGNFAFGFVTEFDQKWLESRVSEKPKLGNEDIQSLADLGNSFAVVCEMRFVPISLHDLVLLFAITLAPFLPLLLTVMPIDQLVIHVMQIVF